MRYACACACVFTPSNTRRRRLRRDTFLVELRPRFMAVSHCLRNDQAGGGISIGGGTAAVTSMTMFLVAARVSSIIVGSIDSARLERRFRQRHAAVKAFVVIVPIYVAHDFIRVQVVDVRCGGCDDRRWWKSLCHGPRRSVPTDGSL